MKISNEISTTYSVKKRNSLTKPADKNSSATFRDAYATATETYSQSSGATTNDTKAADFTSMTRKEMFDWMNERLKSGDISFDDSTAFLAMTVHVSVSGGSPSLDNHEQVNFLQKAQDGLAWAKQNNDAATVLLLDSAMKTMHQYQRDTQKIRTYA
ncbi:hypothetical protein ACMZ49_09385 [Alcaligenes phenolicus]